jgi:hypothetical protein
MRNEDLAICCLTINIATGVGGEQRGEERLQRACVNNQRTSASIEAAMTTFRLVLHSDELWLEALNDDEDQDWGMVDGSLETSRKQQWRFDGGGKGRATAVGREEHWGIRVLEPQPELGGFLLTGCFFDWFFLVPAPRGVPSRPVSRGSTVFCSLASLNARNRSVFTRMARAVALYSAIAI